MATDVEARESEPLFPLTSAEQTDLERYESTIAANLAAFFKVGFALSEVKRRKLYRKRLAIRRGESGVKNAKRDLQF